MEHGRVLGLRGARHGEWSMDVGARGKSLWGLQGTWLLGLHKNMVIQSIAEGTHRA